MGKDTQIRNLEYIIEHLQEIIAMQNKMIDECTCRKEKIDTLLQRCLDD